MKKFLSMFLLLVLCLTLFPVNADAATIKINKTSLILYVGDTTTLKVIGTPKSVKWTSTKSSIASVSTKGKVTAKEIGKTMVVGKIGKKSYYCKIDVRSNRLTDRISEIDNFVIESIWNNGFCNIDWYIFEGTDSEGDKLDIDKTIKSLTESMQQLDIYNKYITGLKGSEYDSLKSAWTDLYKEAKSLYDSIISETPKSKDADSTYNIETFEDYRNSFSEECSYFY